MLGTSNVLVGMTASGTDLKASHVSVHGECWGQADQQ
jgi:hypothetical protein